MTPLTPLWSCGVLVVSSLGDKVSWAFGVYVFLGLGLVVSRSLGV